MSGTHERIDTSRPHPARMYDYYLGGKDWFMVDREAAEQVKAISAHVQTGARANRGFMHRAVRTLAAEYGVRQFLDIGTGIPTEPNLHQVVQEVAPQCRVVYVDHDPLVLEYAHALMRSTPQGRTAYVEADFRSTDLLTHEAVDELLDTTKPLAVSLIALLHFLGDDEDPYGLVASLVDRLPSGSFLALSHVTQDFVPEGMARGSEIYRQGGNTLCPRTAEEVRRFFTGLELLDPGVELVDRWRAPEPPTHEPWQISLYGGLARKP